MSIINPIFLKTSLMCLGVRSPQNLDKGREGGAGPTGGRYALLNNTVTPSTNVPFQGKFVKNSPYSIKKMDTGYQLYRNEKPLTEIQLIENPPFLEKKTMEGIPVWKIASIHGHDALGITINKYCHYWRNGQQCKFCAIEHNMKSHNGKRLGVKTPQQIVEAIQIAVKTGFCNHVTLTTGTTETPDRGAKQYIPILREIRKITNIPIHIQLEPPADLGILGKLYEEGADTIGLHIESLDEKIKKRICPRKVSSKEYFKAWKEAEDVFGQDQVSTFILVGLGEDLRLTDKRLEDVTSTGAIPYIVPFRPLLGTELENAPPPKVENLIEVTRKAAYNIRNYGIKPHRNKAGCVRCGACSAIREALEEL